MEFCPLGCRNPNLTVYLIHFFLKQIKRSKLVRSLRKKKKEKKKERKTLKKFFVLFVLCQNKKQKNKKQFRQIFYMYFSYIFFFFRRKSDSVLSYRTFLFWPHFWNLRDHELIFIYKNSATTPINHGVFMIRGRKSLACFFVPFFLSFLVVDCCSLSCVFLCALVCSCVLL